MGMLSNFKLILKFVVGWLQGPNAGVYTYYLPFELFIGRSTLPSKVKTHQSDRRSKNGCI